MSQEPRLLELVRQKIRLKHYSIRTEESYLGWIKRYIYFHEKKHPKDMGRAEDAFRAKKPQRLPTVLTFDETMEIFDAMTGVFQVIAKILYGCGFRGIECVRLRVKDIDFGLNQIIVCDGITEITTGTKPWFTNTARNLTVLIHVKFSLP